MEKNLIKKIEERMPRFIIGEDNEGNYLFGYLISDKYDYLFLKQNCVKFTIHIGVRRCHYEVYELFNCNFLRLEEAQDKLREIIKNSNQDFYNENIGELNSEHFTGTSFDDYCYDIIAVIVE